MDCLGLVDTLGEATVSFILAFGEGLKIYISNDRLYQIRRTIARKEPLSTSNP